jgi:hypothetical protein
MPSVNRALQHAADRIKRAKNDDAICGSSGLEGGLQGLLWCAIG